MVRRGVRPEAVRLLILPPHDVRSNSSSIGWARLDIDSESSIEDVVKICVTKGGLDSHAGPLRRYTASQDDFTLHTRRSRSTWVRFGRYAPVCSRYDCHVRLL